MTGPPSSPSLERDWVSPAGYCNPRLNASESVYQSEAVGKMESVDSANRRAGPTVHFGKQGEEWQWLNEPQRAVRG